MQFRRTLQVRFDTQLIVREPEHANAAITEKVTNGDHAAETAEENNGGGKHKPQSANVLD
jgi:hypothetical protein